MTQEELEDHNKKMDEFNKILTSNESGLITVEDANNFLQPVDSLSSYTSNLVRIDWDKRAEEHYYLKDIH